MTTYQYKAATSEGGIVDGFLVAESRDFVVRHLRAMGHIPIRIDESAGEEASAGTRKTRFGRSRVRSQQVADATRELSTLLRAGMSLDRALGTLIQLTGDEPLAPVLADIRNRIKQGSTMADAVQQHPEVFNRFYVNLLRAGEAGGALEIVLERLAEHLDRTIEIADELKSALIYPAILIVVAFISIFVLLGYVVPQFTEMFEGVGQKLPLATRVTMGVGEFLQSWGWLVAAAGALAAVIVRRQLRDADKAHQWHALLLRAPLLGGIILKIEMARFARTLATLLKNGIPLLNGMGIVRDTMTNRVLAAGLERVASGLKEGQSLGDRLAQAEVFPLFAVQMIKVGEESGNLADILQQVATVYDRDSQITIKRALALLEPMLILLLGAVIAAVIISILVAILGINELVI